MINSYWVKKLTALHKCLIAQISLLLKDGINPEWLTQGQNVLVMKEPQKVTVPFDYQPITCFCTTLKLLSGIIAAKMSRQVAK